jgi:hypothetical protein
MAQSELLYVYLTPREAAEFLRTSTSTLAKRRLYGDGPKFCRIGRAIRYRISDLDEFMTRSRVHSTSVAPTIDQVRS